MDLITYIHTFVQRESALLPSHLFHQPPIDRLSLLTNNTAPKSEITKTTWIMWSLVQRYMYITYGISLKVHSLRRISALCDRKIMKTKWVCVFSGYKQTRQCLQCLHGCILHRSLPWLYICPPYRVQKRDSAKTMNEAKGKMSELARLITTVGTCTPQLWIDMKNPDEQWAMSNGPGRDPKSFFVPATRCPIFKKSRDYNDLHLPMLIR